MPSHDSNFPGSRSVSFVTPVAVTGVLGLCILGLCVSKSFYATPLPSRKVFGSVTPPTMNQCAECHPEVCENFATAPHRLTLTRAGSPEVRERFAGNIRFLKAILPFDTKVATTLSGWHQPRYRVKFELIGSSGQDNTHRLRSV